MVFSKITYVDNNGINKSATIRCDPLGIETWSIPGPNPNTDRNTKDPKTLSS